MERPDERTLSPEAKEYITYLENRLENMSAMYRNLQKAHFGSKSEKQKPHAVLPADCEQLSIFNEAEEAADAKAKDPTALPESTVEVKPHKRAKKRSREELLDGLPVEIHEYELPAEEQTCCRCGHALEKIGREYIRKECEYIPAQIKVGLLEFMVSEVSPIPSGDNALVSLFFDNLSVLCELQLRQAKQSGQKQAICRHIRCNDERRQPGKGDQSQIRPKHILQFRAGNPAREVKKRRGRRSDISHSNIDAKNRGEVNGTHTKRRHNGEQNWSRQYRG